MYSSSWLRSFFGVFFVSLTKMTESSGIKVLSCDKCCDGNGEIYGESKQNESSDTMSYRGGVNDPPPVESLIYNGTGSVID